MISSLRWKDGGFLSREMTNYLKTVRKLEDFKSTKYNYITYHIVMTLVGYLYFQVYKNLEEGKSYAGKSLPVVVKNYRETRPKSVIIYVGQNFGIFPFLEFLQLYAECTLEVRRLLDPILVQQAFGEIPKSLIEGYKKVFIYKEY